MFYLQKLSDPKLGKKRSKVWFKQAKYDLEASQISLDSGFYEWSTYQAEQAVEKALKSIIVNEGYISPKTHKLSILIGICNRVNNHFRNTKFSFRFLDTFTLVSRYPFLIPGRESTPHELISKDDAEMILRHSKEFVRKIELILTGKAELITSINTGAYNYDAYKISIKDRIELIIDTITKEFDTEKIIIFGSYAKNLNQKVENTIDILIIANTSLSFFERIKKARSISKGYQPSVEPIVYTPEELKFMIEEEGEGFLEKAINEGKVIYDKRRD